MSPSSAILVCLLAASASADNPIVDVINGLKQVLVVPAFRVVSDLCPTVKKVLAPLEPEPDLDTLQVVFAHSDGTNESFNINDAADGIVNSAYFDPSQTVYLYHHGWTDDPSKISFQTLSKALLKAGYNNVLACDASQLIGQMYLRSTEYARYIGQKLAELFVTLVVEYQKITADQIHLIGHSLGAQVCGFTGSQFTNLTGQLLGRIYGLDNAGPCFTLKGMRLGKGDAAFVPCFHTDGGVLGTMDSVGDVDFFPNSGSNQPNCGLNDSCSHARAWQYLSEAINDPTAFPSVACSSWNDFKEGKCSGDIVYMGLITPQGTTGKYYLQTNGDPPYGRGVEGTRYRAN